MSRLPHFLHNLLTDGSEGVSLTRPQGHSAARGIMSIEKSSYLVGNRTRYFPACSVVPQTTTLPRTPPSATLVQYGIRTSSCLLCAFVKRTVLEWHTVTTSVVSFHRLNCVTYLPVYAQFDVLTVTL
jgi:hypothetical protein